MNGILLTSFPFSPLHLIQGSIKEAEVIEGSCKSEQNVFLATGFKRAALHCVWRTKISRFPEFPCPLLIKELCREMHKQRFKKSPRSESRAGRSTCSLWLGFWTALMRSGTDGSSRLLIFLQTSVRFLAVCDCHAHQNPPPSSPGFKVRVGPEGIVKIDSRKTQWGIWMTTGAAECIKN